MNVHIADLNACKGIFQWNGFNVLLNYVRHNYLEPDSKNNYFQIKIYPQHQDLTFNGFIKEGETYYLDYSPFKLNNKNICFMTQKKDSSRLPIIKQLIVEQDTGINVATKQTVSIEHNRVNIKRDYQFFPLEEVRVYDGYYKVFLKDTGGVNLFFRKIPPQWHSLITKYSTKVIGKI